MQYAGQNSTLVYRYMAAMKQHDVMWDA